MAKRQLPAPEHLRQLLCYIPETGKFFWRRRTPEMFVSGAKSAEHLCNLFNNVFAGKEAFTNDDGNGYMQSSIQNKSGFRAHRVAFAIMKGRWPNGEIDHINGDRSDNRWSNLREVTKKENAKNKRQSANSKCPFLGVNKTTNCTWRARIKVNGREFHIGTFPTKEEAIAARKRAQQIHGFHVNHGCP